MSQVQHHHNNHVVGRTVALLTSFLVGLASGTPFLYGAYSPQLIKKVGMTASDSATISLAINIGSGVGGLFGGIIIDHKGPQFSICMGSIFIFIGYTGFHEVYQHAYNVLPVICICAICVGFGSITSYFAALKACQANFPSHRGTAGVFPVSAYGLAATVFAAIAAKFFEGNTGGLLRFLSFACGAAAFIGSFFVKIYLEDDHLDAEQMIQPASCPNSAEDYSATDEQEIQPQPQTQTQAPDTPSQTYQRPEIERTYSADEQSLAGSFSFWGIGTRTPRTSISSASSEVSDIVPLLKSLRDNQATPKRPTFMTRNDSFSATNTAPNSAAVSKKNSLENLRHKKKKSPLQIIKELLQNKVFLVHFLMVGLMAGIGQTYIYSVGFIVNAQINQHPDFPLSPAQVQAIQVGLISTASFFGRLFSGVISDFLYKKYHLQRLWLVILYNSALAVGQFLTMINNGNIQMISFISALIGAAYGLIFGVYPAIIADFFGTKTFSTTWGLICSGPLLFLYVLNKYFGYIYDKHTDEDTGLCFDGNGCYRGAIEACFLLCFVVVGVNGLLIYIHRKRE